MIPNCIRCRFKMRKMQTLAVIAKNLTEIPDDVFMTAQEEGVKIVDLSKNKLTEIPDGYEAAFIQN